MNSVPSHCKWRQEAIQESRAPNPRRKYGKQRTFTIFLKCSACNRRLSDKETQEHLKQYKLNTNQLLRWDRRKVQKWPREEWNPRWFRIRFQIWQNIKLLKSPCTKWIAAFVHQLLTNVAQKCHKENPPIQNSRIVVIILFIKEEPLTGQNWKIWKV